jgi:hypothetical protein
LLGPTITSSPTRTATPSPSPTATLTKTPSPTPTATGSPTPTRTPSTTPSSTSTQTPTITPTATWLASTPIPPATGEGSSYATAVIIIATNEFEGIALENQWLAAHYPGYQKLGQALMQVQDRYYDLITIATSDGTQKVIYFDVTSFFGRLP